MIGQLGIHGRSRLAGPAVRPANVPQEPLGPEWIPRQTGRAPSRSLKF